MSISKQNEQQQQLMAAEELLASLLFTNNHQHSQQQASASSKTNHYKNIRNNYSHCGKSNTHHYLQHTFHSEPDPIECIKRGGLGKINSRRNCYDEPSPYPQGNNT